MRKIDWACLNSDHLTQRLPKRLLTDAITEQIQIDINGV